MGVGCATPRSPRASASLSLREAGIRSTRVVGADASQANSPAERQLRGRGEGATSARAPRLSSLRADPELHELERYLASSSFTAALDQPLRPTTEWRLDVYVVEEEPEPVEGQALEPDPIFEPDVLKMSWEVDVGMGTALMGSINASRELDLPLSESILEPDYVWIGIGVQHRF